MTACWTSKGYSLPFAQHSQVKNLVPNLVLVSLEMTRKKRPQKLPRKVLVKFNRFSTFIYNILTFDHSLCVVNYLDDFLAILTSLKDTLRARDLIVGTLRFLGFHVAFDKLNYPSKCLFVCGISLTSGQLVSELFPDCTRSYFSQVVSRRRGGDRIYEMKCLFVAVGLNARLIVLPH